MKAKTRGTATSTTISIQIGNSGTVGDGDGLRFSVDVGLDIGEVGFCDGLDVISGVGRVKGAYIRNSIFDVSIGSMSG